MCGERPKVHRKHKAVFASVCFHLWKAQDLRAFLLALKCQSYTHPVFVQRCQEDHSTETLCGEPAVTAQTLVSSLCVALIERATAYIWGLLGKMRHAHRHTVWIWDRSRPGDSFVSCSHLTVEKKSHLEEILLVNSALKTWKYSH